jgi:hypothetical protein
MDGTRVQQIPMPSGGAQVRCVRDMGAAAGSLWAITATGNGPGNGTGDGWLWRSADGINWELAAIFDGAVPVDLAHYQCRLYVGLTGSAKAGELWGVDGYDSDHHSQHCAHGKQSVREIRSRLARSAEKASFALEWLLSLRRT